jgi:hypothetical protein
MDCIARALALQQLPRLHDEPPRVCALKPQTCECESPSLPTWGQSNFRQNIRRSHAYVGAMLKRSLLMLAVSGCATAPPAPWDTLVVSSWEGVGMWCSKREGDHLDFKKDGAFSSHITSGCWRFRGDSVVITHPCLNHGRREGEIWLAYADASYTCKAKVAKTLQLSDCVLSGTYERCPKAVPLMYVRTPLADRVH